MRNDGFFPRDNEKKKDRAAAQKQKRTEGSVNQPHRHKKTKGRSLGLVCMKKSLSNSRAGQRCRCSQVCSSKFSVKIREKPVGARLSEVGFLWAQAIGCCPLDQPQKRANARYWWLTSNGTFAGLERIRSACRGLSRSD